MPWAGIILTVLAVLFALYVAIGYEPKRYGGLLVAARLLVAFVWIVCGLSTPARAAAPAIGDTTVPPGMVALALVNPTRDPDVRCVVPNCFEPPVRRRGESQRRFERRLLSPKGPPGRLE